MFSDNNKRLQLSTSYIHATLLQNRLLTYFTTIKVYSKLLFNTRTVFLINDHVMETWRSVRQGQSTPLFCIVTLGK